MLECYQIFQSLISKISSKKRRKTARRLSTLTVTDQKIDSLTRSKTSESHSETVFVMERAPLRTTFQSLDPSPWRPDHWQLVLDNIRTMRSSRDAPVDSMGAEKSTDVDAPPQVRPAQSQISPEWFSLSWSSTYTRFSI